MGRLSGGPFVVALPSLGGPALVLVCALDAIVGAFAAKPLDLSKSGVKVGGVLEGFGLGHRSSPWCSSVLFINIGAAFPLVNNPIRHYVGA